MSEFELSKNLKAVLANVENVAHWNTATDSLVAATMPLTQEQLTDDPRVKALVDAVQDAIDANPTELNLGNYEHGDVCNLQNEAIDVWQILTDALAQFKEPKP